MEKEKKTDPKLSREARSQFSWIKDWDVMISFRGRHYRLNDTGPYSDLFHERMDRKMFENGLSMIKLYIVLYVEFLKDIQENPPLQGIDALRLDFFRWIQPIYSMVCKSIEQYSLYDADPTLQKPLSPFLQPDLNQMQSLILTKRQISKEQLQFKETLNKLEDPQQRRDILLRQQKECEERLMELKRKRTIERS